MSKKGNILYYGVSPSQPSGFGRVCEEIVRNLKNQWHFEILGIGHHRYDEIPDGLEDVRIDSATDVGDAHGRVQLIETLRRQGDQFDVLFVLQDYFTLNSRIRSKKLENKEFARHILKQCEENDIKTVLYMPVEERPYPDWLEPLMDFDRIVLYCDWAKRQVGQVISGMPDKFRVIEHGTNPDMFYPHDQSEIEEMRQEMLPNPDDFVIGYVGDNQRRKNIGRDVVTAFGELWKHHHDVSLMLKTDREAREGWEMDRILWDERMRTGVPKEKMFFTTDSKNSALDNASLNKIYNCFDALVLPSMEGWGLPVTEAFTARTPTIVGDHASLSYVGGGGRSLKINVPGPENPNFTARWVNDNGVQRTLIDIYSFVEKVRELRAMDDDDVESMLDNAESWAKDRPWSQQASKWDDLLSELVNDTRGIV